MNDQVLKFFLSFRTGGFPNALVSTIGDTLAVLELGSLGGGTAAAAAGNVGGGTLVVAVAAGAAVAATVAARSARIVAKASVVSSLSLATSFVSCRFASCNSRTSSNIAWSMTLVVLFKDHVVLQVGVEYQYLLQ